MVARGLVATVDDAAVLIERGVVEVAGFVAQSAAAQVDVNVKLTLRSDDPEYVSRGAHKLLKALATFALNPRDLVALDIGASTGGFTDVLLRHGARHVYAIDVGYGQLAWSLQTDPRVTVLDRTNVRTLATNAIADGAGADLAVIDTSFISLTLVLPHAARLLWGTQTTGPHKHIVALIKPQFEVDRAALTGGVVRAPEARAAAIAKVVDWAKVHHMQASEVVESPITGPAGNIEYLVHLQVPVHGWQSASAPAAGD